MTERSYDTVEGISASLATYADFCILIERRNQALDEGETLGDFVIMDGRILLSASGTVFFADEPKSAATAGTPAITVGELDEDVRNACSWMTAGDIPSSEDLCIQCGHRWTIEAIANGFESEFVSLSGHTDSEHVAVYGTLHCHKGKCAEQRAEAIATEEMARFVANVRDSVTRAGFDVTEVKHTAVPNETLVTLLEGSPSRTWPYAVLEQTIYLHVETAQGSFGIFLNDYLALDLHGTDFTAAMLDPREDGTSYGGMIVSLHGNEEVLRALCVCFLKREVANLMAMVDSMTTPVRHTTVRLSDFPRQDAHVQE